MDLSTFRPFAVVLDSLYNLVIGLTDALSPVVGTSSTIVAIVALTVAVRLVLLPASAAQVRAEAGRRRLAPAVAVLRAKYAGKPELLQKKLTELYTNEKVSPLAGCLPTLLQAPVVTAVYTLFVHQNLAGHANVLLAQTFAGLPLSMNLLGAIGAGLPQVWLIVLVLAGLAVVVELTRRANQRAAGVATAAAPPAAPGSALALRVVPFLSVAFAAVAPLAAVTYLVTSATWSLGEKALLRRALTA